MLVAPEGERSASSAAINFADAEPKGPAPRFGRLRPKSRVDRI